MHKFVLLFTIFLSNLALAQETKLLRFPTQSGDKIVFSYAGDLYSAGVNGGVARRLTNHVGMELFARFSPDGKTIAFTGQYDGNSEIYSMSAEGGVPKRLTYTATLGRDDVSDRMGPNNLCMTWRDNENIVYRSRWKEWNDWRGQLYLAKTNAATPEQLPFVSGGFCSYSPDKSKLAFNRVFREFRTWKRYTGGQADEIWIYDFATKQTSKITDNKHQDIIPMWAGNKIYYLSDRDARMNIFCYDLNTKQTKKVTNFTDFDVKFPSLGDRFIVFEKGGVIHKLDLTNDQVTAVSISIQEDFAAGRNKYVNAKDYVENWDLGSDGNRAVFVARGDIFTVPAKNGVVRNLTNSSGAHERDAVWSPDGKNIAYISDATGEDELYIIDGKGESKPVQITKNNKNYMYGLAWSPDSKYLSYSDRNQNVYIVEVGSKNVTKVIYSEAGEIRDFNWSPDSKYLAYTLPNRKGNAMVNIYSLSSKSNYTVTESWFDSYAPHFSADGKFLYFISQRTFNPSYNNVEWNYAYFDLSKIYYITLRKDVKNIFEPKSDEVAIKETPAANTDKKDEKKEDKKSTEPSKDIDFDGIISRIGELPTSAGNYFGLHSVGDKLFYTKSSMGNRPKLFFYDVNTQKETEVGEANGYSFSADNKKMMINNAGAYYIIDIPSGKASLESSLNLSDMKVLVDRKAEWNQIYFECWRQMRDFFYDPGLHGVDWEKMRDNYASLLPYVNHRTDLTYILGELIGELNCGHAYVGGGDYPKAEKISMGLLGALIVPDASGYYKIQKIYKGQNWEKSVRSPLTEIGVNAKDGDYIIAVNGIPTNTVKDVYTLLVGTADKQVKLTLNSSPSESGSRTVTVIPTGDEQKLIYYNWVESNYEKVNKATGGRVGYVHIPDMGSNGLNEFVKHFYAQLDKEALIVDDRGNGGGNVSPHIIERLRREPVQVTRMRNSTPTFEPTEQIVGPKVALIDEWSASDGDIFAYRFRKHKLGTIIGKRSWGGVVGIRGTLPIVDGGFLNRPEFARYDVDGTQWEIEGHGVDPDIVIDNDPARAFAGEDQQLDKAIELMLSQIKNKTFKEPAPPVYPKK
ncbi:MAG TPA: PDZ domain-containing protein [Saprospiraceae bacterium]|nr:PDZ domain-containing protein [Saprospiraceae bacterium]